MEAGKTVEKQETRGSLREQDSIRALLELLEQQGMEQEKGDVIRMADHIDSMEMQLGTVLKELGEVKKQLGVMQESKIKLFAVDTIRIILYAHLDRIVRILDCTGCIRILGIIRTLAGLHGIRSPAATLLHHDRLDDRDIFRDSKFTGISLNGRCMCQHFCT